MPGGSNYIDWNSIANPNRLSQTVERESLQGCFFSPFFRENYVRSTGKTNVIDPVGDVGTVGGSRPNARFSGAAIEAWTDLQKGGTEVDIPVKLRFIQPPTSGKAPMQGTGEGVRWLWRKGYIHNYKKVAALMNDVDAQRVNEAMEKAVNDEVKPAMVEWKRDWTDMDIQHTFLTGFSANLTDLRDVEDARDLTPYSHPNFFIAGSGRVTFSTGDRPGTAAYEDKTYNGLVTMYGQPTANVKMSAARFRTLRHLAQRTNTMPVMYNGKKMYPVIMKDSAFNQLTEDSEYRNEIANALPGNYESNPLFSGVHAVYNGCLIYVANNMMGVKVDNGTVARYSGGNGLPYYGPTEWLGTLANAEYGDTSDIALTWVLGANSMAKLLGKKRMEWTFEDWDHGQRAEVGMKDWYSFVRTDVWDEDGELGFGENVFGYYDGGIVLATKTPYELAM